MNLEANTTVSDYSVAVRASNAHCTNDFMDTDWPPSPIDPIYRIDVNHGDFDSHLIDYDWPAAPLS